MAYEFNVTVLDRLVMDLYAPGKPSNDREVVTTHDGAAFTYALTIVDPFTGEGLDLSNVDTATVTFKRGSAEDLDDTASVSGSTLSGSISSAESTGDGDWYVYATLEYSSGEVLVTGKRKCLHLDVNYTTSPWSRARKLPRIDTTSDDVEIVVRLRSWATGGVPTMTGITTCRLLIQNSGAGGVALQSGTLDATNGTGTFLISQSRLGGVGSVYTAVPSFVGLSAALIGQKQEIYLVTDNAND